MKQYRTIIRPTDPKVNIALPNALYQDLKRMADMNVRRFSEEVVARLLATLTKVEPASPEEQWLRSLYRQGLFYQP